jgi:hypothetical protein
MKIFVFQVDRKVKPFYLKLSRQLHKMKKEKQFSDVDWNMLNEYLPAKLVE